MFKKTFLSITLGSLSIFASTNEKASVENSKKVMTELQRQQQAYHASKKSRGGQPEKFINENGDYVTVTISSGPGTGIAGTAKDIVNHIWNNKILALAEGVGLAAVSLLTYAITREKE